MRFQEIIQNTSMSRIAPILHEILLFIVCGRVFYVVNNMCQTTVTLSV